MDNQRSQSNYLKGTHTHTHTPMHTLQYCIVTIIHKRHSTYWNSLEVDESIDCSKTWGLVVAIGACEEPNSVWANLELNTWVIV